MKPGQIYKVLTGKAIARIVSTTADRIAMQWLVDSKGIPRAKPQTCVYTRAQIEGALENGRAEIVDTGPDKLSLNPNIIFNRKVRKCL